MSKAKKPAVKSKEVKTPGTRVVEKYRPEMNKLSDTQRQKLLAHAMVAIYGQPENADRRYAESISISKRVRCSRT